MFLNLTWNLFRQVDETENFISSAEHEELKQKYEKIQIELQKSRELNEKLTSNYLKVCEMLKDATTSAATSGMNASRLNEEDQFELASISGSSSHDSKFIKTCILILHDRNDAEILTLSRTGRRNLVAHNKPAKKIDPKKLLIIKNIFCARARKHSSTKQELKTRIESFESLLTHSIANLKAQIAKRSVHWKWLTIDFFYFVRIIYLITYKSWIYCLSMWYVCCNCRIIKTQ